MFTIINFISPKIQLIIITFAFVAALIIFIKIPHPIPKITIIWSTLFFLSAILGNIDRLMDSANYSKGIRNIVIASAFISLGLGFVLLMTQGYRTIFSHNEKFKKLFWIYILGLSGFAVFMAVWIAFF